MKKEQAKNLKRERKYLIGLERELEEALGRYGGKGIERRGKGQGWECTIYLGPKSRDNEATPFIQRVTRGDAVRKLNRRSSVKRRAPLRN